MNLGKKKRRRGWVVLSGTYGDGSQAKVVPLSNQDSAYVLVGGEGKNENARLIAASLSFGEKLSGSKWAAIGIKRGWIDIA